MRPDPALFKLVKNSFVSVFAFMIISVTGTSMAAINAQVGGPPISNITNIEDFETYSRAPGVPQVCPW